MREAAVNVIADTKKKYFVDDLVRTLSQESNLRICARITRALEMLTNERFDPLAFDAVASWWKQHKDIEEYSSPFHHYFDGIAAMKAGTLDEASIHFDRVIEREPQALVSLISKARILTIQGEYENAEKTFKQVEDANKDYRYLYVWRAFLFIKQGNQNDAVNSVNRALEISPSLEEFIRSQPWAKPLLSNEAIKWPSQNSERRKRKLSRNN